MKTSAVIPAKAGIQVLNWMLKVRLKTWIPAFAGMTTLFLFGSLVAWAGASNSTAAPTMEEVLSQIKLKEQSIKVLQFGFEQHVTFLNNNLTSASEGEALFEKPDKLSVHQKKPQEQLTIANGPKTWVYTPSYKQVWVGQSKKNFSELLPKGLIPFQNWGEDLEKNYTLSVVSRKSDPPQKVRLRAIPKQESDVQLEFLISTDSWLPEETLYVSGSAKVLTKVMTVEINPDVPKNAFQFVPPSGTDVIPF